MSTTDPNWSDESFDTMDDGFLPRQTKVTEPVSSYQPPVPPPPTKRAHQSSSPKRAVALLLLFFFTAVGLIITWVVREPQAEKVTAPVSKAAKPTRVSTPSGTPVDKVAQAEPTSVVTRQSASSQQPAVRKSEQEAIVAAPLDKDDKKSETPALAVPPPAPQPTTRSSSTSAQEWCVQVYASTNPDDADEWNDRLRKKNVDDSRIEMIERQGQLWYRVRFGRFGSRQEAEQVAQSMGFRNAWVNRAR